MNSKLLIIAFFAFVAVASAGCEEDCAEATTAYTSAMTGAGFGSETCPDGMQDKIDTMYKECGGCQDWDDSNDSMKTAVELFGCSAGSMTAPAMLSFIVAFFFSKAM